MPACEPRGFVVDLLEDTGPLARDVAELLLSWYDWVEVEAVGEEDLLEGLRRLRGAVMKAATAGSPPGDPAGAYNPSPRTPASPSPPQVCS